MKLKDFIYEQIVQEVASKDVIFSHNGRAVVDTDHATQRYTSRLNNLDMTKFFSDMIDRVLKIEQVRDIPEELMIYSKSYNQAIIVAYRYDRHDRSDANKNFYIITYFPRGNKDPKIGTFPILIEHKDGWTENYSLELRAYLSNIAFNRRRIKLDESTKHYGYFPVSLVNGLDHKIIIAENQLWDMSLGVIEIK